MIRPSKKYLFCILNAAGQSYYVDGYDNSGNPVIATSTQPRWLNYSPINWKETEISYGRSDKYFGVNRNFTGEYQYTFDGYEILNYFYIVSPETKLYQMILQHDSETDTYENFYKSEIDLKRGNANATKGTFTVNMLQGGLIKFLNARENTKYEIPLPNQKVLYDGVLLKDKLNYNIYPLDLNPNAGGMTYTAFPMAFKNNEGDSVGIVHGDPTYEPFDSFSDYVLESSNYVLYSTKPITLTLSGTTNFVINTSNPDSGRITVFYYTSKDTGGVTLAQTFYDEQDLVPGSTHTIDWSKTITLDADEKLFIIIGIATSDAGETVIPVESNLSFAYNSMNDDSTANFIRPLELLQAIVAKMTDNKYTAQSTFFTNNANLVCVSGQSLRNLANAVLVTSFEDFFQSYNSVYQLGVKIVDNVLYVEQRESLFPATTILNSGESKDFEYERAIQYLYSSIKVGYPNQDYNERNGRYEFNTTSIFTTPLTSEEKELNLVSVYRGDCYGIEFIRGTLNNKDTTDAKSDNEVFFTMISDEQDVDGNYLLSRPNYSLITGIPADMPYSGSGAIFNTEISPKRNLLRWGSWIRSFCYKLDDKFVTFQTADKNKDLATTLDGVTIIEKANVLISEFDAAYFYPFIFSFKTIVPDTFTSIMNTAVNGHIQSSYNNNNIFGFPFNMSVRPVFNEAQEWKTLASVANDMESLLNLEPIILNTQHMYDYNLDVPYLCPVQFVPVGNVILPQYNTVSMDAGLWHEQVLNYVQRSRYRQKWQTNDIIQLQCYTTDLGPVQVDILDCKGRNYGTVSFENVITNAVQNPYLLYEGNITLAGLNPGLYFFILTAGTGGSQVQFISELQDIKVKHENTMLFNYSNRRDKLATFFSTGYNPDFRIEASMVNYTPKLNFSSFEDEPADIEIIEAIPYDSFTLQFGNKTFGLPNAYLKKINAITSLTDVYADGEKISREPDAQMEIERAQGVAGAWATLDIRKGVNTQANTMGTDSVQSRRVLVIYNIESAEFGELGSGQVSSNVVQITKVENT